MGPPDLQFGSTSAAGYDAAVGYMTERFVPHLLKAARLAPTQQIVEIACGTGIATEAAANMVGPLGKVVATDISPAMIENARKRLHACPNVSFQVENGEALAFPADRFDAAICSMGLMYFPHPRRGVAELHRVLRPDARAAVTVFSDPRHSLVGHVRLLIAEQVPSKKAEIEQFYAVGRESWLQSAFEEAGFQDIETVVYSEPFRFASFDAYYGGFERGGGSVGQELSELSPHQRQMIRTSCVKS